MLSLVTRNKQKNEAKGPNVVKDEASKLIEYFDFVLRKLLQLSGLTACTMHSVLIFTDVLAKRG